MLPWVKVHTSKLQSALYNPRLLQPSLRRAVKPSCRKVLLCNFDVMYYILFNSRSMFFVNSCHPMNLELHPLPLLLLSVQCSAPPPPPPLCGFSCCFTVPLPPFDLLSLIVDILVALVGPVTIFVLLLLLPPAERDTTLEQQREPFTPWISNRGQQRSAQAIKHHTYPLPPKREKVFGGGSQSIVKEYNGCADRIRSCLLKVK